MAIIGTDREPIRMVCLSARVVYPGDRYHRSVAELDHRYLPVDQSARAAIEAVTGKRPPVEKFTSWAVPPGVPRPPEIAG